MTDLSPLDPHLRQIAEASPYPLLFATVSGAHLYGFASPDSDFDLRGCHLLPPSHCFGLTVRDETVERAETRAGTLIEVVTHDARKYFGLITRRNGYVLEQIFSPLVVATTPEHEELKAIARRCVTRYHRHHYVGFAYNQWELFAREPVPRVKPLLYILRVLLTGIHLMGTGEIEASLPRLNEQFRLSYLPDLIAAKVHGAEGATLPGADLSFYRREFERLLAELEAASDASHLPDTPKAVPELENLLVRLRIKTVLAGQAACR